MSHALDHHDTACRRTPPTRHGSPALLAWRLALQDGEKKLLELMQSEVRQPLEGLPLRDGFKCKDCPPDVRPYLTTSTLQFAKHARTAHGRHGNHKRMAEEHGEPVCLQTFSTAPARFKYFQVGSIRSSLPSPLSVILKRPDKEFRFACVACPAPFALPGGSPTGGGHGGGAACR